MRYGIKFNQNKFGALKIIILALCLLADIIAIAGIISAIGSKNYADIAVYACVMLAVFAIQCGATFLTYAVSVYYDCGRISVVKTYPLCKITIFQADKSEVKVIPIEIDALRSNVGNFSQKAKRLSVNTCPYAIYVIELSGKKYTVNLDDYMYALITTEDDNDLS